MKAALVTMLLLIALLIPSNAQASNEYGFCCHFPVANVSIAYWNLTENFRQANDWNINNNINPTDLNAYVYVNQVKNVNLFDEFYNAPWGGLYECVNNGPGRTCNQANVHYDLTGVFDTDYRRFISCHEMGHASGLMHQLVGEPGTCMLGEAYNGVLYTSSHDRTVINNYY